MTREQAYCQGARCGHLEGKDRVDVYVIGEEIEASEIAAAENADWGEVRQAWAKGYQRGYRLAIASKPLTYNLRTG